MPAASKVKPYGWAYKYQLPIGDGLFANYEDFQFGPDFIQPTGLLKSHPEVEIRCYDIFPLYRQLVAELPEVVDPFPTVRELQSQLKEHCELIGKLLLRIEELDDIYLSLKDGKELNERLTSLENRVNSNAQDNSRRR